MKRLLALLFLIPSLALADLSVERAAELYAVAYGQYGSNHGGFPLPDNAPVIHLTTQQHLQELYECGDCNIQGMQHEGVIYLNAEHNYNSDPFAATILIHEYIHYFQYVQHGNAQNCQEALQREYEAYMIQMYLMARANLDTMSIRMAVRSLGCPHE